MSLSKSISAGSLILALGVYSFAHPPISQHRVLSVRIWDKATLQQAIDAYKEYDYFVKNKTHNGPDTLNNRVSRAALTRVRLKMAALVKRALQFQPLPPPLTEESARKASLRVEIKSLVDAQDLLANLLDISRRLNIDAGLRRAVVNQTVYLMNAIDEDFYAGRFYAMAHEGFFWWTSDRTFHSYIAFGAANPDELEVYLAAQREGIADLARQYAAPVLSFTSAQNISAGGGSVNWKAILDQLDKYDVKKPGNTVAMLENFIRFDMDKVSLGNCDAAITEPAPFVDYFIRLRNSISVGLAARCRQLAGNQKSSKE